MSRESATRPFPWDELESLIRAKGLTLHGVAHLTKELHGSVLYHWRKRARAPAWPGPTPRGMRAVADALGLRGTERARFDPWLAPSWLLRAWCRKCQRHRRVRRTSPADRANLQRRQRPDGSVELLCRRHSASIVGHRRRRDLQRKGIDPQVIQVLGLRRGQVINKAARYGDRAAIKERHRALAEAARKRFTNARGVRSITGQRRSEAHRRHISYALWLHQTLKGRPSPLHACEVCGKAINRHSRHWGCDRTWRAYCMRYKRFGKNPPTAPPPPPGFPDARELRDLPRNYRWAMALGASGDTRRKLLHRDAPHASDPSTVTKGVEAFRRLASGSWNLIFTDPNSRGRTNRYRQKALPLPDELQPLINSGAQDPLILHLGLVLRMREQRIAELTGATRAHVHYVMQSSKASAPSAVNS